MSAKSVDFAYFTGVNLNSACPAQGSASMWAFGGRTHGTKILVCPEKCAIPVWPDECKLRKFHARAAKDLVMTPLPGPKVKR
jgi:hypothetical protein